MKTGNEMGVDDESRKTDTSYIYLVANPQLW